MPLCLVIFCCDCCFFCVVDTLIVVGGLLLCVAKSVMEALLWPALVGVLIYMMET